MDTNDTKLVLSVQDAARLLGLSRGSAYEAIRRGDLPVLRIGRRIVIPKVRLMRMLEGQAQARQEQ